MPNSSLSDTLEGIKRNNQKFEFQIFDKGKIETQILANFKFQTILKSYFPVSYESQILSDIGLNLAIARFGMPQPIVYKFPNEDKTLTLEEVLKLYPQGNQYAWKMFSGDFIFYNNLLAITKIMRGGKFIDPTLEDLEEHQRAMNYSIESIREEMAEEKEKQINDYLNPDKNNL